MVANLVKTTQNTNNDVMYLDDADINSIANTL